MRPNLLSILLAILLALPVAAANWSYRGSNEPDTAFDTPSLMFFDPDTDPNQGVNKVYFNAFGRASRFGHVNSNVAMLGSSIQPPIVTTSAVLAFWKDCNNDGYMGHLEAALIEYRVELLLDDSICSPRPPVKGQTVYPHNDGTWVRELIWIGPTQAGGAVGPNDNNPTNFYADGTAIWGDWGLPGEPPVLVCSGGANLGLRSTGAIVDVVDCNTYFAGVRTLNAVQAETGAPVGGWDMQDIDNSPSPLNIGNPVYPYLYGPVEPAGDPNEGDYRGYTGGIFGRDADNNNKRERMVTLVDCENDEVEPSADVNTPGNIMDPATYPSLYESLNDTYEVVVYDPEPDGSDGGNVCNPSGDGDEGFPYQAVHPEAYNEHTFAEQGRREVDHTFKFSPGSRNFPTAAVTGACRQSSPAFTQGPLGYCPPADLGLAIERDDLAVGPGWRTNPQIVMYTITTRDQLFNPDNAQPDFGGWYMSFYASIGPAARTVGQIPGGTTYTYGSEACGENQNGVHNYWNCDEQAWIARCSEAETATQPQHCYRVGFPYQMRDIDCWDNTLARGTGIRVGLSDLMGSGPCALNDANNGIDPPV